MTLLIINHNSYLIIECKQFRFFHVDIYDRRNNVRDNDIERSATMLHQHFQNTGNKFRLNKNMKIK